MEDSCSVCIMSQALGNAQKGCLVQPKEPEACGLSALGAGVHQSWAFRVYLSSSASVPLSRSSGLGTFPTSVMCRGLTGTWHESGQCNPATVGPFPA